MKKITAIILCLIVILGAVSCTKHTDNSDDNSNENDSTPSTNAPSETVTKLTYEDIITKYKTLLNTRLKGETLAKPSDTANETETVLFEIVRDTVDPSVMGYATKDINGDGNEELVLLNKSNKLYALFSLKDGASTLLLRLDKMSAAIAPDGTVYANQYIKDQSDCTQVKKISGGRLEGLEYGATISGEAVSYYKVEDGERTEITREEKFQLDSSLNSIMINPWYINKTSGFRFVSAVSDTSESTSPVPNFTSYDGIIAAYKTIVESFSEYNQSDWRNGKFDSLFTITDDLSYAVFHEIFWGGIRKMPTETYFGQTYAVDGDDSYGYAKKDINGDGTAELILLNDHYEIFAIFTEKDGRAHLVDGAYSVWIDENGHLRKDVETGGALNRDGEGYVYVFDGTSLKTEIAVGYRVNVYLQKEGWYKIEDGIKVDISAEEGEALYAAYDILPSGFSASEYTRSFAGIEFIPLFKSTVASEKHIGCFSNAWFINGDTLTVSAFTENDVTATIKFVYTDGEFDPETGVKPDVHITNLSVQATRNGSRYTFEKDGVKGYIEFAVGAAWVVVTESENEHIAEKANLFDRPEN